MTKIDKNIWLGIDSLAAGLEGTRSDAEEILNQLELDLRKLTRNERDEIRRRMICIVAQLSRLEVRMMTNDGPLAGAV